MYIQLYMAKPAGMIDAVTHRTLTMFKKFAQAVNKRYNELAKHELFTVDVDLWEVYINAFPEGSNPVFKTNTGHDCTCCKNFVRNLGNVVAIIDGKMQSIWAVTAEYPYDVVAEALDKAVLNANIVRVFRTTEPIYGGEYTLQLLEDGSTKKWNHFFGVVQSRHRSATPDADRGSIGTTVQVFERGLRELTPSAIEQVKDLIDSNMLYRGEEHRRAVTEFGRLQAAYLALPDDKKQTFAWVNYTSPAARFRNTVIGTLVDDISSGKTLDAAVRSFEVKVAPSNYKRPTALITPAMVKSAMAKIAELGIEDSLSRRHARLSDVTINNVLWADNSAKSKMRGGVESLLLDATTRTVNTGKAVDISIEDFMRDVVPTAQSMELLVKNRHASNFVSVTAPVHDAAPLFKWDNGFAWSYTGNVTDSIKERVKAAGGNVDAAMRVSLAWYNFDDLDLHCKAPNGVHYYYGNKSSVLDVDMNALSHRSKTPVENMSFTSRNLIDGKYTFYVTQFCKRETSDVGFEVEVENAGVVTNYTYPQDHRSGNVELFELSVKGGRITAIKVLDKNLVNEVNGQEVWGVTTEKFTRVETLMYSPNHWDGNEVGNKHRFFILEGCKNDTPTRGIYNEYLKGELDQHRKVFEVLGDKTKCSVADEQLSGVGFSSTVRNSVTIKVQSAKAQKTFNVNF